MAAHRGGILVLKVGKLSEDHERNDEFAVRGLRNASHP